MIALALFTAADRQLAFPPGYSTSSCTVQPSSLRLSGNHRNTSGPSVSRILYVRHPDQCRGPVMSQEIVRPSSVL